MVHLVNLAFKATDQNEARLRPVYALPLLATGTAYLNLIGFDMTRCCCKPIVKMQRSLNAIRSEAHDCAKIDRFRSHVLSSWQRACRLHVVGHFAVNATQVAYQKTASFLRKVPPIEQSA